MKSLLLGGEPQTRSELGSISRFLVNILLPNKIEPVVILYNGNILELLLGILYNRDHHRLPKLYQGETMYMFLVTALQKLIPEPLIVKSGEKLPESPNTVLK